MRRNLTDFETADYHGPSAKCAVLDEVFAALHAALALCEQAETVAYRLRRPHSSFVDAGAANLLDALRAALALEPDHAKLIAALTDLFEAFGLSGNLCGVTEKFGEASATEIIAFAARLKRRAPAKSEPDREAMARALYESVYSGYPWVDVSEDTKNLLRSDADGILAALARLSPAAPKPSV